MYSILGRTCSLDSFRKPKPQGQNSGSSDTGQTNKSENKPERLREEAADRVLTVAPIAPLIPAKPIIAAGLSGKVGHHKGCENPNYRSGQSAKHLYTDQEPRTEIDREQRAPRKKC